MAGSLAAEAVDFVLVRARKRGVVGSSATWLGIYVAITAARQVYRIVYKDKPVIERMVLRPGQTVVIRDTGEQWGKAKKR